MELAQMVVYWAVTVFSIASIVVGIWSMRGWEAQAAKGITAVKWPAPTSLRQALLEAALPLLWLAGYALLWTYDLVPGIVVMAMFAYIAWLSYKVKQIDAIAKQVAVENTASRVQQYEHLVNPH